jgi:acyl-CoA reductase-like NAD-dependent aldehyde dehydrogenase
VARPFTDDDDALRQANDTDYGLAASAWTRDSYRAQRASREIHAGCVWINDHIPISSEMPHGGVGALLGGVVIDGTSSSVLMVAGGAVAVAAVAAVLVGLLNSSR